MTSPIAPTSTPSVAAPYMTRGSRAHAGSPLAGAGTGSGVGVRGVGVGVRGAAAAPTSSASATPIGCVRRRGIGVPSPRVRNGSSAASTSLIVWRRCAGSFASSPPSTSSTSSRGSSGRPSAGGGSFTMRCSSCRGSGSPAAANGRRATSIS